LINRFKYFIQVINISDLVLGIFLQPGKDFFKPCLIFSDRTWFEDASSFLAAGSLTINKEFGGDVAWSWKGKFAELKMIYWVEIKLWMFTLT
jgi:hypothetical protein